MSDARVKAVLDADDRRLAANLDGDTSALRGLFTDDFSYTHSNGLREGGSAYLARIDSGAVRYLEMQREDARVSVEGGVAIVEGVARMVYEPRGQGPSSLCTLYLAVWRRIEGDWRISHYASTTAPAD